LTTFVVEDDEMGTGPRPPVLVGVLSTLGDDLHGRGQQDQVHLPRPHQGRSSKSWGVGPTADAYKRHANRSLLDKVTI
jgi:hypothetical protein